MSHYSCAVILPEGEQIETENDVEEWVSELLAPYYEDGVWFRDGSRWDWWVIGGRWDGAIRGLEWSPKLETCSLCNGTGTRPDGLERFGEKWMEQTGGCNGCQGTGEQEAWTTSSHYQGQERNVCRMRDVSPDYTPLAFVRPTGEWVEQARMGFWGMTLPDEDGVTPEEKVGPFDQAWAEAREKYADHLVVGCDLHV